MKKILLLSIFISTITLMGESLCEVSFSRGCWNSNDFIEVKSPRFPMNKLRMRQEDDHIVNQSHPGLTKTQMRSCKVTYSALVYHKKARGNIKLSCRMSFDDLMAPLIVIAPDLGKSQDGKYAEFREHYEVILFNEGINIYHHKYVNGITSCYKAAYIKASFLAKKIYELQISLQRKNSILQLQIFCDGKEFGCAMPGFDASEYYVGLIGCEGINRFYTFSCHSNL